MSTLGVCIWIGVSSILAANEPSLVMRVEAAAIEAGTPFPLSIEARGRQVGEPILPTARGLEVAHEPNRRASQMTWSLGDRPVMTSIWEYRAVIHESGEFEIPPARLSIDGEEVESNSVTVSVASAGAPRSLPHRLGSPLHQQLRSPTASQPRQPAGIDWDEVVFITNETDKDVVFIGEPLTLTFSLWRLDDRNISVGNRPDGRIQHPSTEGFYATALQPRTERRERDGRVYEVSSYSQVLYPTRSGTLQIGGWSWEGLARAATSAGFQRHRVEVDADPIDVEVQPLPPNRPPEFRGAVGRFGLTMTERPGTAIEGEPMRIVVEVSGRGNPFAIAPPEWREMNHGYVADVAQTESRSEDTRGIELEKRFEYFVIPTDSGRIPFPSVAFAYFDPDEAEYVTKTTPPFEVEVTPSPHGRERILVDEQTVAERFRSGPGGDAGLAPLAANPGGLRPQNNLLWYASAAAAAPVAAFLLFAGFVRRRRRFQTNQQYARAYHATRWGHKELARAAEAPDPVEALYRAMAEFIARRFSVEPAGLTSGDVQQLLDTHGADSTVISSICRMMRACERARYAGDRLSSEELGALRDAAEHAMDALDIRSLEQS